MTAPRQPPPSPHPHQQAGGQPCPDAGIIGGAGPRESPSDCPTTTKSNIVNLHSQRRTPVDASLITATRRGKSERIYRGAHAMSNSATWGQACDFGFPSEHQIQGDDWSTPWHSCARDAVSLKMPSTSMPPRSAPRSRTRWRRSTRLGTATSPGTSKSPSSTDTARAGRSVPRLSSKTASSFRLPRSSPAPLSIGAGEPRLKSSARPGTRSRRVETR